MPEAPPVCCAAMCRVCASPHEEMAGSAHADVHLMAVKESSPMSMLLPLTEEGHFQLLCVT